MGFERIGFVIDLDLGQAFIDGDGTIKSRFFTGSIVVRTASVSLNWTAVSYHESLNSLQTMKQRKTDIPGSCVTL